MAIKEGIIQRVSQDRWGRLLIHFLGKPYLAGSSLDEGIRTIAEHKRLGLLSTLDILGESARTKEAADGYLTVFKQAAEVLSAYSSTVSVKPSAICAVGADGIELLPSTPLEPRLEEFVDYSGDCGVGVTLDMENHFWTDRSLRAAQVIWGEGHDNFGIVLQSRLNRTEKDIHMLFENGSYHLDRNQMRVRACIGIYREPFDIATNDRTEAKRRLISRVGELLRLGVHTEIATHDHDVIRTIISGIIEPRGYPLSLFEFQFLKGVENAHQIQGELRDRGYTVRFYMPIELKEHDGDAYIGRRLLANPDLIQHGIKNVLQMAIRF